MSLRIYALLCLLIPGLAHAWHLPWQQHKRICIVINPAGNAQYPGRIIGDTFERTVTMEWAERLKALLEADMRMNKIVITHNAHEIPQPLHAAHIANRLNADLFICLHCYQETSPKPTLSLYHTSYGNDFVTAVTDFQWCTIDQAHRFNLTQTNHIAEQFKKILHQDAYQQWFTFQGPFKLPLRSLLGIKSPAFLIELGITKNMPWDQIDKALCHAIRDIAQTGI